MAHLMYDTSKLAKRDFYYKCLQANFEKKPTVNKNKYKRKFVRKDSRSVIRQSKFIMNQKRKDNRVISQRKRYSYLNNIHKSQQLYQIKLLKKQQELFINELKKKVIISLILLFYLTNLICFFNFIISIYDYIFFLRKTFCVQLKLNNCK
jgi:hypothetical protein